MFMEELLCKRKTCQHRWFPRSNKKPVQCPRCKSFLWDTETEEKIDQALPEKIQLIFDNQTITSSTESYIYAKTKQLQEFGYPSLTEKEVSNQLLLLLNPDPTKELSVIGQMMEGEIVKP